MERKRVDGESRKTKLLTLINLDRGVSSSGSTSVYKMRGPEFDSLCVAGLFFCFVYLNQW